MIFSDNKKWCGLIIAIFLAGCLILGLGKLGIAGFPAPLQSTSRDAGFAAASPAYNRSITLEVPLPASPATVPLYRVVSVQKFSSVTGTALAVRKNIPSIAEAPGLAEKALIKYGGTSV